jgi:hypothetical protein
MENVTLSVEQTAALKAVFPQIFAQSKEAPAVAKSVNYDRKGTYATCEIRGNVGKTPGMKSNIFMFSVASELSIAENETTRKYVDWHQVAVRNLTNNADFISFCQANVKQGSRVVVKGRLTSTKTGGYIIHATKIEVRQGNVAEAKGWLVSDGSTREYNPKQDEADKAE